MVGDYPRPGWLEDLALLLERGVKVTMVFGDRDYACNWIGGEASSLAINYSSTAQFHAAGYEPIQVNATYEGGLVRQYGNLSFSRVFQAGHEVPSWQPETAAAIFTRALGNRDIATGSKDLAEMGFNYTSVGPPDTWATRSKIPDPETMFCYLLDAGTCTEEQLAAASNGSARVVQYIIEDANSTRLFPEIFRGSTSGDQSPHVSTSTASSLRVGLVVVGYAFTEHLQSAVASLWYGLV